MVGDYVLQADWMAKNQKKSAVPGPPSHSANAIRPWSHTGARDYKRSKIDAKSDENFLKIQWVTAFLVVPVFHNATIGLKAFDACFLGLLWHVSCTFQMMFEQDIQNPDYQ